MIKLLRKLASAVLPARLRARWHHYLVPEDYYFLRKSTLGYAEDNLFTGNAAPFLDDQKFQRAYELGEKTDSWHGNVIRWRVHIACWVAEHAARLPGDFVECGVNRGGLARAITTYTQFGKLDKKFFLIDTFEGLVPEYLTAGERQHHLLEFYDYYKNNSRKAVAGTFADVPNVEVIQGRVPDVLSSLPVGQVAYLSLDMNCTIPEIKAAEYFWERLTPGGMILLDDYTQVIHAEQQKAFDQFARERGTCVLALPTGQGLILKGQS